MCVIPLITEGERKSIVQSKEDFQIGGAFEGNAVLINGFESEQLSTATKNSNASYDLRVGGDEYRDHRHDARKGIKEGGTIVILPGAAVIIETIEHFTFPRTMFGLVIPKVGLLQKGISNTMSKVDPGYQGKLIVTIFNLGKKKVPIKWGDRFCSLCIMKVGEGATLYNQPGKQIDAKRAEGVLGKVRDHIEANSTLLITLNAIAALVLIITEIASRL